MKNTKVTSAYANIEVTCKCGKTEALLFVVEKGGKINDTYDCECGKKTKVKTKV